MKKISRATALLALICTARIGFAASPSVLLIQNHSPVTLHLATKLTKQNERLLRSFPRELKPNSTTAVPGINDRQPDGFAITFAYQATDTGDICNIKWTAYKFDGTYKYTFTNIDSGRHMTCNISSTHIPAQNAQPDFYKTILSITPKS